MTNSYKRSPVCSITGAPSNKKFKQMEHRRERSLVKQILRTTLDDSKIPGVRKWGNEWASPRDGKCWVGEMNSVKDFEGDYYMHYAYYPKRLFKSWAERYKENIKFYRQIMRK